MPGTSDDNSSELFARALDGEVGAELDADVEAELRRDLALAAALGGLRDATGPDAAARERMRATALAGFAAATADARATRSGPVPATRADTRPSPRPRHAAVEPTPEPAPGRRGDRRSRRAPAGRPAAGRPAGGRPKGRGPHGVHGRLLAVTGASLCLLLALSGMSLVFARDALPGDALYGVKRSAESAQLGATFGDESRAFKHLDFATARVNEIEALAVRGTDDSDRFLTALQAFDIDAAAGSRLLIDVATNGSGEDLATLAAWARQQQTRIDDAAATMPSKASTRAGGSLALLDKMVSRTAALEARLRCLTVTSVTRDDVGLLPSDAECVPVDAPAGTEPGGPTGGDRPGGTQPGATPSASQPSPGGAPVRPLDPFEPVPTGAVPAPGESGSGPADPNPSAVPTDPESPPAGGPVITLPLPLPLPPITLPPLLPGGIGLQLG